MQMDTLSGNERETKPAEMIAYKKVTNTRRTEDEEWSRHR